MQSLDGCLILNIMEIIMISAYTLSINDRNAKWKEQQCFIWCHCGHPPYTSWNRHFCGCVHSNETQKKVYLGKDRFWYANRCALCTLSFWVGPYNLIENMTYNSATGVSKNSPQGGPAYEELNLVEQLPKATEVNSNIMWFLNVFNP